MYFFHSAVNLGLVHNIIQYTRQTNNLYLSGMQNVCRHRRQSRLISFVARFSCGVEWGQTGPGTPNHSLFSTSLLRLYYYYCLVQLCEGGGQCSSAGFMGPESECLISLVECMQDSNLSLVDIEASSLRQTLDLAINVPRFHAPSDTVSEERWREFLLRVQTLFRGNSGN